MATIEENIFKRAKIDFDKLSAYGFDYQNQQFVFSKIFMNGDFKAEIFINKNGCVSGDVYDMACHEIYVPLRVDSMAAGFAGKVRHEYEAILQDIKAKCCFQHDFIFPQSNRLAEILVQRYGTAPDFPWPKYNGFGVFRNAENSKWYALFMNVDKSKFDKKAKGEVEAVNLKIGEDKIDEMVKIDGIYPAYHMNKKSWISVLLDDSLSDEQILALLEVSYNFTLKKKK